MITKRQKEIAANIVKRLKERGDRHKKVMDEIRANIRKENEYAEKQEKAQTPTREQMERRFDI